MSNFDLFFLSYDEPEAEANWINLSSRYPGAIRVHGIKGILHANQECARQATTEFFFVVDGDNVIVEGFEFAPEFQPESDAVYVWRCKNPVNGLVYGFGAVKLLPRALLLSKSSMSSDMTTNLSAKRYVIVDKLASITAFNTSAFSTWRTAFRECTKLASGVIARQKTEETVQRLMVWTNDAISDQPFSEWCIKGAMAGKKYGTSHYSDPDSLGKINDFSWLRERFETEYGDKHL